LQRFVRNVGAGRLYGRVHDRRRLQLLRYHFGILVRAHGPTLARIVRRYGVALDKDAPGVLERGDFDAAAKCEIANERGAFFVSMCRLQFLLLLDLTGIVKRERYIS